MGAIHAAILRDIVVLPQYHVNLLRKGLWDGSRAGGGGLDLFFMHFSFLCNCFLADQFKWPRSMSLRGI